MISIHYSSLLLLTSVLYISTSSLVLQPESLGDLEFTLIQGIAGSSATTTEYNHVNLVWVERGVDMCQQELQQLAAAGILQNSTTNAIVVPVGVAISCYLEEAFQSFGNNGFDVVLYESLFNEETMGVVAMTYYTSTPADIPVLYFSRFTEFCQLYYGEITEISITIAENPYDSFLGWLRTYIFCGIGILLGIGEGILSVILLIRHYREKKPRNIGFYVVLLGLFSAIITIVQIGDRTFSITLYSYTIRQFLETLSTLTSNLITALSGFGFFRGLAYVDSAPGFVRYVIIFLILLQAACLLSLALIEWRVVLVMSLNFTRISYFFLEAIFNLLLGTIFIRAKLKVIQVIQGNHAKKKHVTEIDEIEKQSRLLLVSACAIFSVLIWKLIQLLALVLGNLDLYFYSLAFAGLSYSLADIIQILSLKDAKYIWLRNTLLSFIANISPRSSFELMSTNY